MKTCNTCLRVLDETAFDRRKASPDGLSYKCKACAAAYRNENRTRYKELRRLRYAEHRTDELEKANRYYAENREDAIAKHAAYMKRTHVQQKNYSDSRREEQRQHARKRRTAIEMRTPPWLSDTQLREIEDQYRAARMLQNLTGQELHVDHIVPLQGKRVSGLHVPWNLRIVPAKINRSKKNSHG